LFKELCNTLDLKQIGAPTVQPVFYGEHRGSDRYQAVLATIALEGYSHLNSLLQDPSITAPVRQAILQRLADVIQLVHRHRLQHNSLGGNHVLIKMEENDGFDLRILNPENITHSYRHIDAAVKDLDKFIRCTPGVTMDELGDFLLHYTRYFSHGQRRKLVERINKCLLFKCSRKGMIIPETCLAAQCDTPVMA
jgi:hypothetical protein